MRHKHLPLALLAVLPATAGAAGFALIEQNASGLGNAYAGQAAVAEDASTVFFNPAGMSRLEGRQAVLAGHYISPSARFSGTAAPPIAAAQGGDAGVSKFVPNAYYVMDVTAGVKFGLGLNAPFGLATQYDFPWAGMTQALKSDMKTLNVNPALSWRVSDHLAVGAGLNWQRIEAELSSYNPLAAREVTMKGDDASWGWNLGALWDLDADSRVGLAYRARTRHELSGDIAVLAMPITAAITLPDTASLSLFKRLTPSWELLADVTWTGWSSFDELRVRHAVTGGTVSLVPENWDNTWRYSVGVNYRADDKLTWRFGVAYDQTPVPDAAHRTPRIPDEDRTWLALGASYAVSARGRVDVGYAHLFVRDARIDHAESGLTLSGTYEDAVDILSVQYSHRF